MGVVDVKHTQEHEITLEWDSSASNDMIADSTLALLTTMDSSPASVKSMSQYSHPLQQRTETISSDNSFTFAYSH
jgi:cleavage and polyadenylation specificity factor subunit 3